MKIECGTDANQDRTGQVRTVLRHPALLSRSAQTDKNQIGAGVPDSALHVSALVVCKGPEWRRKRSGDFESGNLTAEVLSQLVERGLLRSIKENPEALTCRHSAEMHHQRGPVYALLVLLAKGTQGPDDRHAIGRGRVGSVEVRFHRGIENRS